MTDDPTYCSPSYRAAFDCGKCGNDKTWCSCPPPKKPSPPPRVDLRLQGAIGQTVVRIEQDPYRTPRIHLSDGTILTPVASGRDAVRIYRMPKT